MYKYNCVVFEGGGIHGAAVVGIVRALEELQIMRGVKYFAGSSIGAINAAILSVGATSEFIDRRLFTSALTKIKDADWDLPRNLYRLFNEYGYCRGDFIYEKCRELLGELTGSPDITFAEAHLRYDNELVITATNLDKRCTEYWTWRNRPNMSLATAMRISASYPGVFRAIRYEPLRDNIGIASESKSADKKDLYIDGGTTDNFPIRYMYNYSAPDEILAFKFISPDDRDPLKDKPVRNLYDYFESFVTMYFNMVQKQHVKTEDFNRAIKIPVGDISALDFSIPRSELEILIKNAYLATMKYFATLEFPTETLV